MYSLWAPPPWKQDHGAHRAPHDSGYHGAAGVGRTGVARSTAGLAPDEIDNGGTIRGFAIIDSDLRPASVEFADGSNLEVENVTELWGFLPDNNAP